VSAWSATIDAEQQTSCLLRALKLVGISTPPILKKFQFKAGIVDDQESMQKQLLQSDGDPGPTENKARLATGIDLHRGTMWIKTGYALARSMGPGNRRVFADRTILQDRGERV
jgi:hypothetical protein